MSSTGHAKTIPSPFMIRLDRNQTDWDLPRGVSSQSRYLHPYLVSWTDWSVHSFPVSISVVCWTGHPYFLYVLASGSFTFQP